MGSDTKNIIYTLFNTILSRIQQAIERQNERGSGFTHIKDQKVSSVKQMDLRQILLATF